MRYKTTLLLLKFVILFFCIFMINIAIYYKILELIVDTN